MPTSKTSTRSNFAINLVVNQKMLSSCLNRYTQKGFFLFVMGRKIAGWCAYGKNNERVQGVEARRVIESRLFRHHVLHINNLALTAARVTSTERVCSGRLAAESESAMPLPNICGRSRRCSLFISMRKPVCTAKLNPRTHVAHFSEAILSPARVKLFTAHLYWLLLYKELSIAFLLVRR